MTDHKQDQPVGHTQPASIPPVVDTPDTIIGSNGPTDIELGRLLRDVPSIVQDPIEAEPQCANLISRLKDINEIRRLAAAAPHDDAHPDLPKSLGQFELLESLGGGGMGQVFRARHAKLGKIQAVKLLHAHRLQDKEATDRFYQEMKAIGRLHHPNIVAAQHADEANGVPYLVMDFVDGQSFSQIVKQQNLAKKQIPVAVACELIRQAAVGIQYAHEQGVVHRDIKPGNLMLDRQGVVRVLDLGLARIAVTNEFADAGQELTTEQQVLGTPDYVAPEQLRSSRNVDARADVYALGATLYCLLTGQVPYPSSGKSTPIETALRVLNEPVPNIRKIRINIPAELANLVTKCLTKEPDQRIATATELVDRLKVWASREALLTWLGQAQSLDLNASLATEETVSYQRSQQPPARRSLLLASGFLLPMILLAIIVFRLKLPNGGELTVECDDPEARITVVAVKGEQTKALKLSKEPGGSILLTEGTWDVRLEGLSADEFDVSEDRIVISAGGKPVLRVTRRMQAERTEDKPEVATTKPETLPSKSPDAPNELNFALNSGDPSRTQQGMVIQPTVFDPIFDWQLLPTHRSFSGTYQLSPIGVKFFDVDPTGNYAAFALSTSVTVRHLETDTIVAVVESPPHGDYWHDVSFAPDGKRFAVATHDLDTVLVEIRSMRGILLERWSHKGPMGSRFVNVQWTGDGHRICLAGQRRCACVYARW